MWSRINNLNVVKILRINLKDVSAQLPKVALWGIPAAIAGYLHLFLCESL